MPAPGPLEILVILAIVARFALPLVALIVLLRRRPAPDRVDPAMETLRTRFAKGEIDEAEYLRLRSTLQRG
jgi:putative membrane protein